MPLVLSPAPTHRATTAEAARARGRHSGMGVSPARGLPLLGLAILWILVAPRSGDPSWLTGTAPRDSAAGRALLLAWSRAGRAVRLLLPAESTPPPGPASATQRARPLPGVSPPDTADVPDPACSSAGGGPADNPVASRYGDTAYPWTDEVRWRCVQNIADFDGATPLERILQAEDALGGRGGVVYVPAGTYAFADDIPIANGVVIRGEPTSGEARAGDSPGTLRPRTRFVFPDRQYKGFVNRGATDRNIGVVNIDSDGGAIKLGPSIVRDASGVEVDIAGMGANKIVFGNRIANVSFGHPSLTGSSVVWPYRFARAISVNSDRNALIANNLIPAADRSALTTLDLPGRPCNPAGFHGVVPYPYDDRSGIYVNRDFGAVPAFKIRQGMAQPGHFSPETFPWMFRRGLVIRDNYVYVNGQVGISWSGMGDGVTRGSGTQVIENHVEVKAGDVLYTVTGSEIACGSSTNENRGYEMVGWESRVERNTGRINRQRIVNQLFHSNDGEGILQYQDVPDTSVARGNVWDGNDLSGGESGSIVYWNMSEVSNVTISNNAARPGQALGIHSTRTRGTDPVTFGNVCFGNSAPCEGIPMAPWS